VVADAGAERVVLAPGERRTVGTASFEVLAPDPDRATAAAAANDLSMVVRATQRGVRVLLTGDLGAEAEARIVADGTDLSADVLKVPHHGSADADPDFLAASGAAVALVSVGADNTYGHPTDRLLDWLAAEGMRTYRTDRDGDLAVVGRAGEWGVAVRGPDLVQRATALGTAGTSGGTPVGPAVARSRRQRVAAWRRGSGRPGSGLQSGTPGTDLAAARRRRRGGAAALPRRVRRARRRARPPPRQRGARARRGRPADR
jgi:competence protein ComEC